ncbi:cytochrome c [Vibrio sp. CDRSL-10 TSBA]
MSKSLRSVLTTAILLGMCSGANASSGQEKFATNCSGCHGLDAKGIVGLAPSLDNPELWKRLGSHRDQYIAGVVTGGMSGKIESLGNTYQGFAMPPQNYLETADLVEITHYILSDINHLSGGPDANLIDKYKENPLSHPELHQLRDGE